MWKMTLKQRRRHGELLNQLDKLRRDPYAKVPADYQPGKDEEEDAKYKKVFESLKSVVEEIQALETSVRDQT